MQERLGVETTLLARRDASVYERRLDDGLLSDLIRLFLLERPVDVQVLAPIDPGELRGLIEEHGRSVRSTVAIQPWRDLLALHDWADADVREDQVVGVSSISSLLADLTVRRPVATALDLGTGSGSQALLAARHAGRVIGLDVNLRALRLAGWALALNGVENVELRAGDWFEPVAGEQFELVVANPPFIVSPEERWLYRDGGHRGSISRKIVESVPAFLREGGFAHVLCQWPLVAGEAWDAQPRAWTGGRGCDAWLLRVAHEENLVDYAAGWNDPLREVDEADFEAALDRWLDWFAAEGFAGIAFGLVSLRKRTGRNWVRTDETRLWPPEPVGDHAARVFAGATLVEELAEGELLDLVLEPAPGFRVDETRAWRDGTLGLVAAQPRLSPGIALRPRLSQPALDVLRRLDGRRSLRELGAAHAVDHLRELVALGFLEVRRGRGAA